MFYPPLPIHHRRSRRATTRVPSTIATRKRSLLQGSEKKMALRGVACLDCNIECERLHKTEGGFLHIHDRFFKIMFGKDRSKFMYLPPESAKIMKHLTNQETQIEDSSGQRWVVTLSLVNDSLAFQKGWQKFYLDHGLKEGELLVFEYTGGSHFTVQIYATSARERTNFNCEMPCRRKKRRIYQGTASRDISISASGDEHQNRKTMLAVENAGFEGSQLLPIPVDVEDPICMIINQSVGYHEEQRRLYESSFGMDNRTSETNKCEGAASIMLDPHTETEQIDVNLDDASGTKFSSSCNRVLEPTPYGDEAMEQTKSTSEDAQMVENATDLITNGIGDISIDKFETALDAKTALSHTEIADEKGMLDSASGCNFQDGKEPSMMLDHPQMNYPPVEPTNLAGDDTAEQAKTTGDISIDKIDTALDAKAALSHTEITEQIRKKMADTQMAPHSRQTGGNSGDAFINMFYEKPSVNSKRKVDNVCNVQDGKRESVSLSPSIGDRKIAEREHAAKSKFGEFSVSSSTIKHPLGLHAIKKEVKMEATANLFHQIYEKMKVDNVCNVQDGKLESVSLSPSIGDRKIAEREHAAKSKFGEFSVSSSTIKHPLGLHAIKKEVKMEATANLFHQIYEKMKVDNVCNVQDGKRESVCLSPSIGDRKITEREHAAKSKFGEFSVSSSTIKHPLGLHAIKKEVKMEATANLFHQIYEKPSVNSKRKVDNVCNVQDGKREPVSLSPSIGDRKIAEREHAAKSKFGEFSVSSSTVKDPLGLHAINKEVKMEGTANLFHQVSSGGKEPPLMWNKPQMISPLAVKVEADLQYETGQSDTVGPVSICSFSAEVESKSYLEVPQIMSGRGRRLRADTHRAQIVYLRGSAQRLWPVVYREYTGRKAFIGNWSCFCDQNNIKPGDKCRFQAEKNIAPFVFTVEVDRGSR